jgi:HD-GYP domain-containing protein (c-di-GMP phosphodiesterase class II)
MMARVLLLGPDRQRAAGIHSLLAGDGHEVNWSRSSRHWPAQERELQPDVVVAAVATADAVLAEADRTAQHFAAPLLFVQSEGEFLRDLRLARRLVDCLASPFMGEELLARVDALVRVLRIVRGAQGVDETRAGWRRVGHSVSSWIQSRLPSQERPAAPYLEVAARVAEWTDRRDAFEPGHAARVTSFCAMIAEGLGMCEQETSELLRAAMLHDIGKVSLPTEILHQREPLAEGQRRLLQTHPARGAALLRALGPDDGVARVVLCHHERPDGTGYYGKLAAHVPRAAQALAVAETYDAMTSSLLGETVDSATALNILRSQSGPAFAADCVDSLIVGLAPRAASLPLAGI